MKKLIYFIALLTLSVSAQENNTFTIGVTSNIDNGQLCLRGSYLLNNDFGVYTEFQTPTYNPNKPKGNDLSSTISSNSFNDINLGENERYSTNFKLGVVKKVHDIVYAYAGVGYYDRFTFTQLEDPSKGASSRGYYYYKYDQKNSFYINLGLEVHMKFLVYQIGYDLGMDGLNIGAGVKF